MLTDGRDVPAATAFVADLCIIGAGPAGLAIIAALQGSKLKVLLIERGDVDHPAATDMQSDLDFESPHFRFQPGTIRNQFGGMAPTWKPLFLDASRGARLLPLDPIDFEARYWVPHSGWPVTFAELAPYYNRARMLFGIEPFDFHAPLPAGTERTPLSTPSGALVTRLEQFGSAAAFTTEPLADLRGSGDVHVVTNAMAVELMSAEGAPDGMAITTARALSGGQFTIRSRAVVLAGGSVENARLLLNSTAECPAGLGNQFDNVGRFFMEHPRVFLGQGSGIRAGAVDLYQRHIREGQIVEGRLKLSETVLRREQLLNGSAYFVVNPRLSTEQVQAWRSALRAKNSIKHRRNLPDVPSKLAHASRHAPAFAWLYLHRYLDRSQGAPIDPDASQESSLNSERQTGLAARSFELIYQPEQAPNRVNRVTLSARRDSAGYPIAHLYWRWSEIDLLSIRRVGQIFANELRASGMADLVLQEPELFPQGEGAPQPRPTTAHHLLGTTRMHDLPRQGVVDRNCRVHGFSSVYVASASVFTTAGSANPTLTVVALAVRLADELRRTLLRERSGRPELT